MLVVNWTFLQFKPWKFSVIYVTKSPILVGSYLLRSSLRFSPVTDNCLQDLRKVEEAQLNVCFQPE
ncbi:hypothetical protein HOLleu_44798 [Holothuria leucospilota]|uniref:Uncharacterized protein n=1 Tax=Holothuria leucospilota TaxID=206669 RepID=A0A9Q1B8J6_HOLLE|nr:hypothetical protein HOLleu_44798 [Holothuria leucospilota]